MIYGSQSLRIKVSEDKILRIYKSVFTNGSPRVLHLEPERYDVVIAKKEI